MTRRTRSALSALGLLLASTTAAPALPIITEYVEGSGKNQAIEIFNPDAAAIDLTGWTLEIYNAGNTAPDKTVILSGMLAAGDVLVVARDKADAAILAVADLVSKDLKYSGDDAIVLSDGTNPIDRVGQVGFDPGFEWGSGLASTEDNTLSRNPSVSSGDPSVGSPFDPSLEWTGFATDSFSGLGAPPLVVPEVSPLVLTGFGLAGLAILPVRRRRD